MERRYYLLLLLCIAGSYSCKKSNPVVEQPLNVYVAGYEFDMGNVFAKYWKNGNTVPLSAGSNKGRAMSITVSGPDVYMAGYEHVLVASKLVAIAKYWKNGRPVGLGDSLTDNYALSIAVSGIDVYVAGYQASSSPFSGTSVAKYWKNGIPVILSDTSHRASAYAVAVSGNDVYVTGSESTGSKDRDGLDLSIAKYWKNGTSTILSDPSIFTAAKSIVVSGNDVYVTRNVYTAATYWKNGNAVRYSNLNSASINSIAVSGDDVYLAGNQSKGTGQLVKSVATYWRNGTAVSLTDGLKIAAANSIAVSGSDVYVAGYEENGFNPSTWSSQSIAKYWRNGNAVTLSDSSKYNIATSIFLSRD